MSSPVPGVALGTPDHQGALRTGNFEVLPGFGDDDLYYSVPRSVLLARRGEDPDFFLEFVSDQNGGSTTDSLYAILDMGLSRGIDPTEAYQLVKARHPDATLMPATFTTDTFWHLECEDRRQTAPFAWDDALTARIHARLDTKTADLVYSGLAIGSAVVLKTAVECGLAAILPRVETSVDIDPAALLQALSAMDPTSDSIAFAVLVAFCQAPRPGILTFDHPEAIADTNLGVAVAGRISRLFGHPAPCERIADGPRIGFKPLENPETLRANWDLRTPVLASIPVFLAFDPFTPVVAQGDRDQVTAFTNIPPLPLDLLTQRVAITSGLPANIANIQSIQLTLRVDKEFSRTGSVYIQSADLYPAGPGRTTTRDLLYKKIGAKPYDARLTIATEDSVVDLPWTACQGDYLYIDSRWLGGRVVDVRATAELLAQADISATIEGTWIVKLDPSTPTASLLLPKGLDSDLARLRVTAAGTGLAEIASLDLPCNSVSLDLSSFGQYGPQNTQVTVEFPDGIRTARYEFAPECGDDAIAMEFSPTQPSGQFSYFSTRLFQDRYRYRPHFENDDSTTGWSEYQPPRVTLRLVATAP